MSTPAKVFLNLFLAVGIFAAGYMANRQPGSAVSSASGRQPLYYHCPMHPQFKSDRPGDAPCCGMRMEPVYAGDESGAGTETGGSPGALTISAAKQQLIGVRTGEVMHAPASHVLRLYGRVAADEARVYRLIAAADGWIQDLGPNPAGTFVRKHQVLASYYTQNLQAAQQALFTAMAVADRMQGVGSKLPPAPAGTTGTASTNLNGVAPERPPVPVNLQNAIDTLRGLGMHDLQIQEIRQARRYDSEILIYAPIAGYVVARNVSPGQLFERGTELYRIADLERVWVIADVFEKDRELLRAGAAAAIRCNGRELPARMSHVLPQLDPQSRTLKVRFELSNPERTLLPDTFVDVVLRVERPAAVTVPADAVIDSGLRKLVYVERARGEFEPRAVQTGWRLGDRVQITSGLEPGERIVVSGNFLIDSESRMRLPAAGSASTAERSEKVKDLVCGMDIDPYAPNVLELRHGGETYYFCAESCKKRFEANPANYLREMAARGKTVTRPHDQPHH